MDEGIIGLILLGIVTENITHIFQRGKIFETARNFFEFRLPQVHCLLNCQLCLSFWVAFGVFVAYGFFAAVVLNFYIVLSVHAFARYVGAIHFWLMKI